MYVVVHICCSGTHLLLLGALLCAGTVVRVLLARVVAAGEEAEADPIRLQALDAHHHVVVRALQPLQLALHVAQVLRNHLGKHFWSIRGFPYWEDMS